MKKINITESDLTNIVKQVIKEQEGTYSRDTPITIDTVKEIMLADVIDYFGYERTPELEAEALKGAATIFMSLKETLYYWSENHEELLDGFHQVGEGGR